MAEALVVRILAAQKLGFDRFTDKGRHAVGADKRSNPLTLFVSQPHLRFFHL